MATREQRKEFINTVGTAALKEAQERRAAGKKWILPGICVSQGACECAWGTSKAMVGNTNFEPKADVILQQVIYILFPLIMIFGIYV